MDLVDDSPDPDAPAPLAELGHELRTPLTAILGFADAISAEAFGPLPKPYVDCAEAIAAAGRHMLALVDDLTALARLEAGRWTPAPERFALRDMIAEVRRLFSLKADQAGVGLRLEVAVDHCWVRADPRAMRQILINLTANALTATPPGGEVTLTVRAEGALAVIEVVDTGVGPPVEGAASGAGLGLRLVAAYCAAQGGGFRLSRAPGGGAIAIARLPILAAG